jgi:MFS transporter, AAHS family, 4-hydroxybenzoate transporter
MDGMDISANASAVRDSAQLSRVSLIVAICASAILILDGLDIQVIGMAAPDVVKDLGIERSALAPALAAALLGMALGASTVGAMGDRWGRRPALLASTLIFGCATLLAATSSNVAELAFWRFLTGIGLGGALPCATALIAEFTSRQMRSQAIGAAQIGVPIGGILGAALAGEIIPDYGWRMMFAVGGVLPIAAAIVMYFVMPESPRFLASRTHPPQEAGVRALFTPKLRHDTFLTTAAFFTNIFVVYAFFNWSPLVLTSMGFGFDSAVRSTLIFNLAGIVGALVIAVTIARFGSRMPLATSASGAVLALVGLACMQTHHFPSLMSGIAIAGATICAIQVGMYAVAANVFPTRCRSSGIGWALGAGRLGGILSAFGGGLLLAAAGANGFFWGVSAATLLTLITVLLLRGHISPSHLQEMPDGSTH